MIKVTRNFVALGLASAMTLSATGPSMSLPLAASSAAIIQSAPESTVAKTHWRGRYWGRGWGWGVGAFALGAAAAGAYYYPRYYGHPYYYGYPNYGYARYYYADPYYGYNRCWRRWGRIYCGY